MNADQGNGLGGQSSGVPEGGAGMQAGTSAGTPPASQTPQPNHVMMAAQSSPSAFMPTMPGNFAQPSSFVPQGQYMPIMHTAQQGMAYPNAVMQYSYGWPYFSGNMPHVPMLVQPPVAVPASPVDQKTAPNDAPSTSGFNGPSTSGLSSNKKRRLKSDAVSSDEEEGTSLRFLVKDSRCVNCTERKKVVFACFPCSHAPVCIDCIETASSTHGNESVCGACFQIINEKMAVFRIQRSK